MQNGECIQTKICGVECMSTHPSGGGMFSLTSLSIDKKNDVLDSCLALCGSENAFANTVRLLYGIISVTRVNLTNNLMEYNAAIICITNSGDDDGVSITSKYCAIHKNIASGYRMIRWEYDVRFQTIALPSNYPIFTCDILV